jgi:hypothetical protein
VGWACGVGFIVKDSVVGCSEGYKVYGVGFMIRGLVSRVYYRG